MHGGGYNYNRPSNQENYYTRPPPQFGQNLPHAQLGQVFRPPPGYNAVYAMPQKNTFDGVPNVAPGSFLLATPNGVISDWPPQYGGRQPPPLMSVPMVHCYQQPALHGYNPYLQRPPMYPQQEFVPSRSGIPVPYGMPLTKFPPTNVCQPSYQVRSDVQDAGSNVGVCDSASLYNGGDVSFSNSMGFSPSEDVDRKKRVYQVISDSIRQNVISIDAMGRLPSVSAPNLLDVSQDSSAANSVSSEVPMKASVEPYERTQSDANLPGKRDILQNRLSYRHKMESQRYFTSEESAAVSIGATIPSSGYHSGSSLTVTSRQNLMDDNDDSLAEEVSIDELSVSTSPNEMTGSGSPCIMPEGFDGLTDLKGITFGWSSPSSHH